MRLHLVILLLQRPTSQLYKSFQFCGHQTVIKWFFKSEFCKPWLYLVLFAHLFCPLPCEAVIVCWPALKVYLSRQKKKSVCFYSLERSWTCVIVITTLSPWITLSQNGGEASCGSAGTPVTRHLFIIKGFFFKSHLACFMEVWNAHVMLTCLRFH